MQYVYIYNPARDRLVIAELIVRYPTSHEDAIKVLASTGDWKEGQVRVVSGAFYDVFNSLKQLIEATKGFIFRRIFIEK